MTKIQPVQSIDIRTEKRERLFEVSLDENPVFHSKREAERVAKAVERAMRHKPKGD